MRLVVPYFVRVVKGWRRGRGLRLATLLVAAALPGVAPAGQPILEELRLVAVRGGQAIVLRLSESVVPAVLPMRGSSGGLQRLQIDLPPGTRLAAGVPRVVRGAPPIIQARVGVISPTQARLIVEVVEGARFQVRSDATQRRLTVAVTGPASEQRVTAPALVRPRTDAVTGARSRAPVSTTSGGPASAAPARRRLRVVLDAGHGGDDPGAVGYVVEKHVTLDVVRRLARRLRDDHQLDVVLTRSSDATVPLSERTAIANQAGADVFVSIHANAQPRGRSKGIETYLLDDTDDHATLRLAAIENGTAREVYRAGPTDLGYILSSLVQGGKMPDSSRLAAVVHRELVAHMQGRYPDIEDLGLKRGPFYVLVGSHMPCILIETSFVSHPVEGRRLADEAYRAALADGVANGIRRFLGDGRAASTL